MVLGQPADFVHITWYLDKSELCSHYNDTWPARGLCSHYDGTRTAHGLCSHYYGTWTNQGFVHIIMVLGQPVGLSKKVCVFAGTDRLQPIYQSEGCEIFNNDCYILGDSLHSTSTAAKQNGNSNKGLSNKNWTPQFSSQLPNEREPRNDHHGCQTEGIPTVLIMVVNRKEPSISHHDY